MMSLKPSELIKVCQEAIDAGCDDIDILFDTEARTFNYHMAHIGRAHFNGTEITGKHFISLHEKE